jgi:hypothetical protein
MSAITKSADRMSTMQADVDPSIKKLRYIPLMLEKIALPAANHIIWPNRRAKRNPIHPGVISIEITRMIPTAFNEATTVAASNESIR